MGFGGKIVPVTITLYVIALVHIAAYSPCTSISEQFQGYTYTVDIDTGAKVWSHCAFPSPIWDQALCGRPETTTTTNYICDPDGLLASVAQGDEINLAVSNIQTNTSTVCVDSERNKQSYMVGVVLIDSIRRPDLRSPDLCINECGELQPVLNETVYNVTTEAEDDVIMANFGEGIRRHWQLGTCGNDVIIFYCKQLNEVYISVGSHAAKYLTNSKIQSLSVEFMAYVNDGRLEEGLLFLVDEIRHVLRALSPAYILLIIGMSITFLFGAGLVYSLFVYEHMDVWGMEKPFTVLGWLVYLLTGVWFIKGTILFMLVLSHKVPYWSIGVLLTIATACILVYALDRSVFGDWEDNPLRLGHLQ